MNQMVLTLPIASGSFPINAMREANPAATNAWHMSVPPHSLCSGAASSPASHLPIFGISLQLIVCSAFGSVASRDSSVLVSAAAYLRFASLMV